MRQRSLRRAILSVLVMAGLAACATQKEPPPPTSKPGTEAPTQLTRGVVGGTVTDARTGDPLGYVSVRVRHGFEVRGSRGTMTGNDGSYRIGGLALGPVEVEVLLYGYVSQDTVITLARDRTQLRLDFALRPEPAAPPQARPDSVIADGSSIMTQEKEYGASFQPPTPNASVEADAVEESTGRQGGLVKRMSKLFARGGRLSSG